MRAAPVCIRQAALHDLPAMRALMRATPHAPAWNDAALAAFLQPSAGNRTQRVAWIAQHAEEEALGGFVAGSLVRSGDWAESELEYLVVQQGMRRSGVGRLMLGVFLRWSQQNGAHSMRLEVRASNHAARALYERAGFHSSGRRPAYYTDPLEDAVLMQLDFFPHAICG